MSRRPSFASCTQGIVIAILLGGVVPTQAAIYTFSSAASGVTYTSTFDPGTGLTGWAANGANQLNLQSLYYSVGYGTLSQLSGASVVAHGSSALTATYTVAGVISVADTITLNGNTLGQQIKFTNLSGAASTLSLFQYSDFTLGNAPGSQTLNMVINSSSQAAANQSGGGAIVQWLGQLTGGTVEVQANNTGAPFGPFNGTATTLNNTTLSAAGNAVFGYEFDAINLASGNSLTVSETAALVVPEPSSMGLISGALAVIGAAFLRRRLSERTLQVAVAADKSQEIL